MATETTTTKSSSKTTKSAPTAPATTPSLPGKFVWLELATDDAAKAKGFYGELLGWTTSAMPMGDATYEIIENRGTGLGGFAPAAGGKAHWHAYLSVADVDASCNAIVSAGGAQLEPAIDVPGVGRMAKVRDPQGATFSLMRSVHGDAPDAKSTPAFGVHWLELWTTDDAKALSFYEKALGFSHRDMDMGPMGVYRVLEQSGAPRGGIMRSPDAKVAPMWLAYVSVEDVDRTTARAKQLGGKVIAEPSDIPNIGRFSIIADPVGAVIALITPSS